MGAGIYLYSHPNHQITAIEAAGVKFEVGKQSGIATAQKEYEQPIQKLVLCRNEVLAAFLAHDDERGFAAVQELDRILNELGIAQQVLEVRKNELMELQEAKEQLALSQQQLVAQKSEEKPVEKKSEKPADPPAKRNKSKSNSAAYAGYDTYSIDSSPTYQFVPQATPSMMDPVGYTYPPAEPKKPNFFQRLFGGSNRPAQDSGQTYYLESFNAYPNAPTYSMPSSVPPGLKTF